MPAYRLIILAAALAYTNYLIDAEIPNRLLDFIKSHIDSRLAFLILLNIFLLIVGCMLDIFSALVLVVPLIIPIAEAYDVNLIHLGIIFLTNLQIGYCTPPLGVSLYISGAVVDRDLIYVSKAVIPFLLIQVRCAACRLRKRCS